MNSTAIAFGILEAIAMLVGLAVICVLAVWSFLGGMFILAMLDQERRRVWSAFKAPTERSIRAEKDVEAKQEPQPSVTVQMPGVHSTKAWVERS